MLDRQKVIVAFEEKRERFQSYAADQVRQRDLVRKRLDAFLALDRQEIETRLAMLEVAWPGALPTAELDRANHLRIPFAQSWANHEEARAWARDVLQDRPVAAVDGSQITPTKDWSVPVGAVQVGWFINHHCLGGNYVKNIEFDVLAPPDLEIDPQEDVDGDRGFPNWKVSQERFVRECRILCRIMADFADAPDLQKPVCLFDGSFVISFAGQMRPARAKPYLEAVAQLLHTSEVYGVPVVAFVDTSYSRDFVTLLNHVAVEQPSARRTGSSAQTLNLSDAALFSSQLPEWGDRCPLFICARNDGLSQDNRAPFYRDVAFTYMRLVAGRAPARIELPAWLLDRGRVDDVLDLVRAESVVGAGYPYAIETADALAVISQHDRQQFYALFEQFAARAGLSLTQARKAASKLARR